MATTATPGTPRGMQPPDKKPVRITVPEDRKVRYGDPFFPKVLYQAIFYITAVFCVLIFLALASPAPLQDPADPLNHAAIDPKPEWYFMFLFQLLKYFQGPFIVVGTVIIPTILVLLLLGLPFYDRNWARKIVRRPLAAASMSIGMLLVIFLTWGGLGFPKPDFSTTSTVATGGGGTGGTTTGTISPAVAAIFSAHCSACHLNGNQLGGLNLSSYAGLIKGGSVVPGPVIVPGNHANSVLWKIIQPGTGQPGGNRMPLGGPYLSAADINTIATWIDGLGKGGAGGGTKGATGGPPVSFKSDVSTIFTAHCATCHLNGQSLGGLQLTYAGIMKGGIIVPGPAVKPGNHASSVLWQIIQPGTGQPGGNRMPLGGPYLSDAQINTIANWIDQGAKNN